MKAGMIVNQETINRIDLLIDYILDSEVRDFKENPSHIHIFYHAYALTHGLQKADEYLQECIDAVE